MTHIDCDKSALDLDGAIVTGAGSGIGRACAIALARRGAAVLCISRERSAETASLIRASGGSAEASVIDIAHTAAASEAVADWLATHPEVNRVGLVLAAAIIDAPRDRNALIDLDDWEMVLRTNVIGNLAVSAAALPRIIDRAFGRFVFFGGGGAAYAYPLLPAYGASKAATVRAVENLADDLRDISDASVVCLAPGALRTRMGLEVRRRGGEVRAETEMPEVVQFVEAFMASPLAPALTGRFVHVRDSWRAILEGSTLGADVWRLRRIE